MKRQLKVLFLGTKEFPFGSCAQFKTDSLPSGGIEAYADSLARELARQKSVEVTIVTRRFKGQKEKERIAGVNVVRVPWVRGFLLRNPSYNYAALRAARKLDFDLVHAHGPVAALFAERLGKPVVATPHGVASGQPQYNALVRAALRRIEKKAYSRADAIVFLSEAEKTSFKEKLDFLPRRSAVIPTGVDLKRFSRARSAFLARTLRVGFKIKRKFVVCFVGRLLAVKGVRYLIEAAALLEEKERKKIVFLIAGDGPERDSLEKLARKLGVEENFLFLGERLDVPTLLAASDCFVLPSLSEGMPLALLEALAAGAPCVVTRIGLPVRDEREAIAVPPANARELARAIGKLEKNAALRAKLARNGLAFAKKFSWKRAASAHAALYSALYSETAERSARAARREQRARALAARER